MRVSSKELSLLDPDSILDMAERSSETAVANAACETAAVRLACATRFPTWAEERRIDREGITCANIAHYLDLC